MADEKDEKRYDHAKIGKPEIGGDIKPEEYGFRIGEIETYDDEPTPEKMDWFAATEKQIAEKLEALNKWSESSQQQKAARVEEKKERLDYRQQRQEERLESAFDRLTAKLDGEKSNEPEPENKQKKDEDWFKSFNEGVTNFADIPEDEFDLENKPWLKIKDPTERLRAELMHQWNELFKSEKVTDAVKQVFENQTSLVTIKTAELEKPEKLRKEIDDKTKELDKQKKKDSDEAIKLKEEIDDKTKELAELEKTYDAVKIRKEIIDIIKTEDDPSATEAEQVAAILMRQREFELKGVFSEQESETGLLDDLESFIGEFIGKDPSDEKINERIENLKIDDKKKKNLKECVKSTKAAVDAVKDEIRHQFGLYDNNEQTELVGKLNEHLNSRAFDEHVRKLVALQGVGRIVPTLWDQDFETQQKAPKSANSVWGLTRTRLSMLVENKFVESKNELMKGVIAHTKEPIENVNEKIIRDASALCEPGQKFEDNKVELEKYLLEASQKYGKFGSEACAQIRKTLEFFERNPNAEKFKELPDEKLNKILIDGIVGKEGPPKCMVLEGANNKKLEQGLNGAIACAADLGAYGAVSFRHETGRDVGGAIDLKEFGEKIEPSLKDSGVTNTLPEKSEPAKLKSSVFPFRNENLKKVWSLIKGLLNIWTIQSSGFSELQKKAKLRNEKVRQIVKEMGGKSDKPGDYHKAEMELRRREKEQEEKEKQAAEAAKHEAENPSEVTSGINELVAEKHKQDVGDNADALWMRTLFLSASLVTEGRLPEDAQEYRTINQMFGEEGQFKVDVEEKRYSSSQAEEKLGKGIYSKRVQEEISSSESDTFKKGAEAKSTRDCVKYIVQTIVDQIEVEKDGTPKIDKLEGYDDKEPVLKKGGELFHALPGAENADMKTQYASLVLRIHGMMKEGKNPVEELKNDPEFAKSIFEEVRDKLVLGIGAQKEAEEIQRQRKQGEQEQEEQEFSGMNFNWE